MITYEKIKISNELITSEEMKLFGRLIPTAFTRNKKLTFENIAYFILNKRGLTLEMELDNFKDIVGDDWERATESALCQQRKNFNPNVFKEINKQYIIDSYDTPGEYRTLNGYLVLAIDGMDMELPDVEELRKEYGEAKGSGKNQPVRATTSTIYDVMNNMAIDSQIARYKTEERELAIKNIREMESLIGEHKKIIIFDRGYPSLEMIYTLEQLGIKYIFRGKKENYQKEIEGMKTKDEIVSIEVTSNRVRRFKNIVYKEAIKEEKEIKFRVVKYELETGEKEILITNLSEEEFGASEIGELYFTRWKIELAYDIAKNKLEIENISGQSKITVEQEFYSQMYLLNVAEDMRKDANKKVKAKKENGYKYDYKVNINTLIGHLRKRFITILISLSINNDEETNKKYFELMDRIKSSLIPIRPNRKKPRKKYRGCNKHKQNLRRNS